MFRFRVRSVRYVDPGGRPGFGFHFRVTEIGPHIAGQKILIPPFVVTGFAEVVFIWKHNTVFEYMRYLKDGWFET